MKMDNPLCLSITNIYRFIRPPSNTERKHKACGICTKGIEIEPQLSITNDMQPRTITCYRIFEGCNDKR